MATSNPESKTLAQRIARAFKGKRATNESTFVALRDDIADALSQGIKMSTIHKYLKDNKQIAFEYDAFRRYVKRHIRAPAQPEDQKARGAPSTAVPSRPAAAGKRSDDRLFKQIQDGIDKTDVTDLIS